MIQSFMTAAVGLAVYQWMSAADIGYLDLQSPKSPEVLCVSEWPLRHASTSWWASAAWSDWFKYRQDMRRYVHEHQCIGNASSFKQRCDKIVVPLNQMDRSLGIPLGLSSYNMRNDSVEAYGYLFLYMTICLWLAVTTHDLALLSIKQRDYIYDLRGIRKNFRCCMGLYRVIGFRCWKRMMRGKGLKWGQRRFCQKFCQILAWPLVPLFAAWWLISFFIIVLPVVATVFIVYPIRLSRVLIFLNSIAVGLEGVALTLHAIAFLASVEDRQIYAVTWKEGSSMGMECVCGCMYPLSEARCWNLMIIGITVAYKSLTLSFRCLKGLRRSNWASLMSVLFPIPATVYEVLWTRPDGSPIQHRVEGVPVQGELAFDPFALMDEQIDSGRTTVNLVPVSIKPSFEPMNWSVAEVVSYFADLGMPQYGEAAERNGVDGPTFLQLCRKNNLEELGVTSKIHASKIRARLGTFDAASARAAGGLVDNSRISAREVAGPQLTPAHQVAEEHRRDEYIGCCGFPCRRGENGTQYEKDSDDEGANATQEQKSSAAAKGGEADV